MSFQKGSSTSTKTTSHPDYVEAPQRDYYGKLAGVAQGFWDSGGMPLPAPTANEQDAKAMASTLSKHTGHDYSGAIAASGGGYTPQLVTGEAIVEGMNPYLESVGKAAMGTMRRERDNRDAQIGARNASAVAFGGSGPALERAQNHRGFNEDAGAMINKLLADGYSRSEATQLANAQMANQAAQFGASQQLAANVAASGAVNDNFGRKEAAYNVLSKQSLIDSMREKENALRQWNLLKEYGGALPEVGGTTSTSKPEYFNPLSMIGLFK